MNEIKQIRKSLGLTQTEFGKKFNIPMRTIQNWEGGQNTPPAYVVELIKRVIELEGNASFEVFTVLGKDD